jgi:peroxiredoxin
MAWASKRTLQTGDIVPDVPFTGADGEPRNLSELLQSGPVLLAFFKVACPTCQLTLPYLNRLSTGGTQAYAVSQDKPSDTHRFNATFGVTLPELFDRVEDDYPASSAFGLTHVPSMFLVEPDRRIVWDSIGFYKRELVALSEMIGHPIFHNGDIVPEMKAG